MSNQRRHFLRLAAGALAVPASSSLVVAQGNPSRGREAPIPAQTSVPVNIGLFKHEESALILIDYQPEMFKQMRSEPSEDLIDLNVRLLIGAAKAFDMPIILSTVGVKMGVNHPTKKSIRSAIPEVQEIDRSSMDAWEDNGFRNAVTSTGRKRLIFGALWTEICLAFAVLEARKAGYDVMFCG